MSSQVLAVCQTFNEDLVAPMNFQNSLGYKNSSGLGTL